ncbi:pectinesterase PPME1-like [Euphorbia lathyris]|uniref:pectinesterase PPME1-like n=1 Tax=Euphorbia lathyris TaxID=212925 RepID=UPI0033138490
MCDDKAVIPAVKSQINQWFLANVLPFSQRKATLNPVLAKAEATPKMINVRKDGTGDFTTITDAVKAIPAGNTNRVIIYIGPGVYTEKILIERTKPFVTLYANAKAPATVQFSGTAKKFGTFDSATIVVESDYFVAANLIIKNSALRPTATEAMAGAQALALRLSGDMAALYNCKMYGYQDTFCDEKGRHFFKDCYIEGTVDFIFGSGKSLYVNTELHIIPEKWRTVITAQAKHGSNEDSGFSFVHCTISGTGKSDAYLGRAWVKMAEVVYSYTYISNAILPEAWDNHGFSPENMYFGEFQNIGPGANLSGRKYSKHLTAAEATKFMCLGYIMGSQWLLPPPSY